MPHLVATAVLTLVHINNSSAALRGRTQQDTEGPHLVATAMLTLIGIAFPRCHKVGAWDHHMGSC